MKAWRLSVPGNLLLAGEYAILEEGGLGFAFAVDERLSVTLEAASRWEIVGKGPGEEFHWFPPSTLEELVKQISQENQAAHFFKKLYLAVQIEISKHWHVHNPQEKELPLSLISNAFRMVFDTSDFYHPDGQKKGLGSSAALAVGLTYVFAKIQGIHPSSFMPLVALHAHRVAQGGLGSGYDVLASAHKSLGMITGGRTPTWQPHQGINFPLMAIFAGKSSIQTTNAITKYRDWKSQNSEKAKQFLQDSNQAVSQMAIAKDEKEFLEKCVLYSRISQQVGKEIGVPTDLTLQDSLLELAKSPEIIIKALGAGNELGIVLGNSQIDLPPEVTVIRPSKQGVSWEEIP